jgi:hypothetical protein
MSFLESVYRKVSMLCYRMALPEMREVLERGHEVAKRGRYLDYLAKMKLLLSLALVRSGEIRRASRYTNGFWKLMRTMDDPDLKRTAVILISVVMSLKGRISEAADYHEKMTDFTMAMRAVFLVLQADGTISIVASRNLDASFFGRNESDVISEPIRDAARVGKQTPMAHNEQEEVNVLPLADMVARYLEKILRLTRWRVKGPHGAAQLLGLKPTTLFSLMNRYGVHRPV